ncbi:hypothetical protein KSS87_010076 [Heliosperma pusillum]|nr:hypothetical protein KSS87_010076 [Heliosperma pusillum]
MADSVRVADSRKELKHNIVYRNTQPKQWPITSIPKYYTQKAFKHIVKVEQNVLGMGRVSEVGLFLLKLAVLEAVRRFSNAHCPLVWQSLQALQLVCVPPLKWIGKWRIFRGFLKCMQALSRPLLVLSIASLADGSDNAEETSGNSESDSRTTLATDSRSCESVVQSRAPEDWQLQLLSELQKEGIVIPARITEDDLRRFYHSVNGDFSRFLTSVKKTIKWRQNFTFLSAQELEDWSEIVFWHGCDLKGHPCLIIRVAPACSNIVSDQRSRLPEVVVSQIEHGILHLVPPKDPRITVFMDCEGLTPFRFPVHMMRSCAILLQDHYPNRLAALFVVRLPPIARVVMQTLFKVLRPGTRKKLRILGQDYQQVLSEQLPALPSLLGGNCSCPKCSKVISQDNSLVGTSIQDIEPQHFQPGILHGSEDILPPQSAFHADEFEIVKYDRIVKTVVIGLLVLFLSICYGFGFQKLESLRLYSTGGL